MIQYAMGLLELARLSPRWLAGPIVVSGPEMAPVKDHSTHPGSCSSKPQLQMVVAYRGAVEFEQVGTNSVGKLARGGSPIISVQSATL